MKKTLIVLFTLCLLFTGCGNSSSSSESSISEESSAVYDDVKVKDIIFPASCKLKTESWSDSSYDLLYDSQICINVRMIDVKNASDSLKQYYQFEDKPVLDSFALFSLVDGDENAASTIDFEKNYSNSGFKIYKLSRDDVYGYYAVQIVNNVYYTISTDTKHYKLSLEAQTDKELNEYYDAFCDVINSIQPA